MDTRRLPGFTEAAPGGEEQAAVKARAKAMNDLFGSRVGRGQRVLKDPPTDRRADFRTLALEVATLYVVNALVQTAAGSEQPEEPVEPEEPEGPEEGTEKGKGKGKGKEEKEKEKEVCSGLPHLGDLTWAKQYEKWKQEGLDARQRKRLAAQIQLKSLRSLPDLRHEERRNLLLLHHAQVHHRGRAPPLHPFPPDAGCEPERRVGLGR